MFSYLPFEHYQKPYPAWCLYGILSGSILKNLVELVLQETSLLAHTLNEIKALNVLESNYANNEIKMPQTEKAINTEKCTMCQVSHPAPGSYVKNLMYPMAVQQL